MDINAVKERIDYDSYYKSHIKVVRERGDERDCLCPFHQDSNPSFNYNARTGLWICHACGARGDIFQFHMKLYGCDFKTAMREIAHEEAGVVIPLRRMPQNPRPEDKRETTMPPIPPEEIERAHLALLNNKKALEFLREKRGWTIDTIKRFKLGYQKRRVLIPIYDEHGDIVNIRRYSPSGQHPKMLHWAQGYGQARWWPVEHLKIDEVVIFEGEPDTILACQLGLPGITQTAGAETFKPEWAELFRSKKVWICYDRDDAGTKGAEKAAKILARTATEVRIVELPVSGDKNDKDFTDWVLKHSGTIEQFYALMETTPAYVPAADESTEASDDVPIEEQINSLPPDIDWEEHQAAWKRLIRSLVKKRPAAREQYIKLIKERFKLGAKVIRDEIKAEELAMKVEPPIPAPLDAPRQTSFVLAQDMVDGVFHYGIWLPTNKGEFVFRLVTSEKKLLEAPENVLAYQLPKDFARWSVDSVTPFNVFEWLAGKATIDVNELFTEIREFIRKYMWYPDKRTYTLIAIWIMQTYVFMLFDQIPYLALVGTKRAGKTRLFEILEMLCFNARLASSVTDAYLFRSVEIDRTTLLVDEADQLKAPNKDGINEKLEILRSGYRRSGSVGRIEGDDRARVDFSTYSMKAIANVSGLEDALEDRTIALPVERKPKEVKVAKLVHRRVQRQTQILRNKLYVFGLQYAERIAEIYDSVEIEGVDDREAEIWSGPMCIARLLGNGIPDMIAGLARENSERKALREGMESVEAQEIIAIWTLVTEEEPDVKEKSRQWYRAERLRNAIADQLGWDSFNYNRLSTDLVKLRLIEDSPEYKQRFRVDREITDKLGNIRIRKSQVMCYWLKQERIIKAAERFGVDLEQKSKISQPSSQNDDESPW